MSYRRMLAALGTGLVLTAAPLAAQATVSATPAPAPAAAIDSTPGTLRAVVVTAERAETPRTMSTLEREKLKLRRVMAMQDQRIAELRVRVAAAKAANDAKVQEITAIDSAAAATRAQRMALEQRLRGAEPQRATAPER